MSTGELAIFWG